MTREEQNERVIADLLRAVKACTTPVTFDRIMRKFQGLPAAKRGEARRLHARQ
jgi:hypothetical protein